MPALNISNIKDAKFGSTDLSAVYKGSTQIYRRPPFILHPINLGIVTRADGNLQMIFWACNDRQFPDPGGTGAGPFNTMEGSDARGTDLSTIQYNHGVGQRIYETVDGVQYTATCTLGIFTDDKGPEVWKIKLALNYGAYGTSPYSVILADNTEDPDNPVYHDDRFPSLEGMFFNESEIEDG